MDLESEPKRRIRFTTDELHAFQEALLVIQPSFKESDSYSDAQWNLLCSAATIFTIAVEEEESGRPSARISHVSDTDVNDFGGVNSFDSNGFDSNGTKEMIHWILYANPSSINIKRDVLLCSRIGIILENRDVLGFTLFSVAAFNIALEYFIPVSDVTYITTQPNGDRVFDLRRCGTAMLAIHMFGRVLFGFLLAHRINRQIFFASLFYCETVISTGTMFLAYLGWMGNCYLLTQASYNAQTFIEDLLLLLCSLPAYIFVSASDSLRFGLRFKILSVAVICTHLAMLWLRSRCITDDWGEPINCESMDSDGFSLREVNLMACTQILVFFMQGFVKQVCGDEFAVIHPHFIFFASASDRNDPGSDRDSRKVQLKMDCYISMGLAEVEALGKLRRRKLSSSEGSPSHVEHVAQTSELRNVVQQLRLVLVRVLNSAWNESIPLDVHFERSEVSHISSGRASNRQTGACAMNWHLRSEPARLELCREAVLTSKFGTMLFARNLNGKVTAALGFLGLLQTVFLPTTEVRKGDITYPLYPIFGWVTLSVTVAMILVVLQHSMNRNLVKLAYSRFETWVLTFACLIRSSTCVYQALSVFPFQDIGIDLLLSDAVMMPLLNFHLNCIDSWRFSRKTRVGLYFLAILFFMHEYYIVRCDRTYWLESTQCSIDWQNIDGIRLREIYLGLVVSCFVFFGKALHRHFVGHVFAVWHPRFQHKTPSSENKNSDCAVFGEECVHIGKLESENTTGYDSQETMAKFATGDIQSENDEELDRTATNVLLQMDGDRYVEELPAKFSL